jgi:hypothetical protein
MQGLTLMSQVIYHINHASSSGYFFIFLDRDLLYTQLAWTMILYLCFPHS